MIHSHPNKWAYGGIIREYPWAGEPGEVLVDGTIRKVEEGDVLKIWHTGMMGSSVVEVEKEMRE